MYLGSGVAKLNLGVIKGRPPWGWIKLLAGVCITVLPWLRPTIGVFLASEKKPSQIQQLYTNFHKILIILNWEKYKMLAFSFSKLSFKSLSKKFSTWLVEISFYRGSFSWWLSDSCRRSQDNGSVGRRVRQNFSALSCASLDRRLLQRRFRRICFCHGNFVTNCWFDVCFDSGKL